MSTSIPLILDTDIGTDVDDLLALVLAATAPEFHLLAVSTVNGNTQDRAAFAARVLRALGRDDVAIGAGRPEPIDGRSSRHMPRSTLRHLIGAAGGEDFPNADDVIRAALKRAPAKVAVCAIGAYSNIASVFRRDPSLLEAVDTLAMMGGCLDDMTVAGRVVERASYHEYNVSGDPRATELVFGLPVRRLVTAVDATYKLRLSEPQMRSLAARTPIEDLLLTEYGACLTELLSPDESDAIGAARVVTLDDPAALLALLVPTGRLVSRNLRVVGSEDGALLVDADDGAASQCWIPASLTRADVLAALDNALSRTRPPEITTYEVPPREMQT